MVSASPVFVSVRELGERVRTRQVSPVELAEFFVGRLESFGPAYNAVVTLTRERAMEQARRAEAEILAGEYRGPLHGIPYGAKDLLATGDGIPTTWGAAPLQNQVFDYDATVVRKLEEAGAVLVAKLAMVELAGGLGYSNPDAAFTGPGLNPWDTGTWTGGSSSGSGAAVAAGLVPFAIGSETWGSILMPASYCGTAGLRPTYGRVSRYGAMALSWTLDKLGPLGLTADDCGLVLDAIAGPDPLDRSAANRPYRYEVAEGRRFRLAVRKGATEGADDAVRFNFERAVDELAQVADIDEVELPDYPYEAVTLTIFLGESSEALEGLAQNGIIAGLTNAGSRLGHFSKAAVLAKDFHKALRIRGQIARDIDHLLGPYDALLTPTTDTPALPIDVDLERGWSQGRVDIDGAVGNALGLPAVSVPTGLSEAGLPTAIEFLGRAYAENTVLSVARAYQGLTRWHEERPPGALPE
jgi:aspartyl-tRNA(Asn)/glutamyl-tRNA(Gln) amidotransferase subunit A